jgi:diazepam-binding inhibitor (GABA receptor modulator, acyl-CoA-binding protein)
LHPFVLCAFSNSFIPTKKEKMTLTEKFNDAAERVKGLTNRPSNEQLLNLYALYKQGTEGDVRGEKPGMFDFKGAAKYAAWENLKGMSADEAQEKYVALVDELIATVG